MRKYNRFFLANRNYILHTIIIEADSSYYLKYYYS